MTIKIKTLTAAIIAATSLSACNLVIDAAGNADQTTDTNTNEPVAFSQWQLQLNNNVVCSDDLTLCADVQLQAGDQLVLKLANQADIQLSAIANLSSVLAQPAASAPTFATWKNNLPAAFAMQHDDWCGGIAPSLYDTVLPEVSSRGLTASIGVIAGNCNEVEWSQAKEFLAAGFSIFNHSMTHGYNDAPTWQPDAVITWQDSVELSDANALIAEKTGYTPTMHGIPYGLWSSASNDYLMAHGTLNKLRAATFVDGLWKVAFGINSASFSNSYDILGNLYDDDWGTYNKSYQGAEKITKYLDDTIAAGGFGLQYFHGVADSSYHAVPLDIYQAALDYLKAKVDGGEVWLDHAETIIDYRKASDNCVATTSAVPFGYQVMFDTSEADCAEFLTELTMNLSNNNVAAVYQGATMLTVDNGAVNVDLSQGSLVVLAK